jgi:dipeptidyl aminopeptidase/acylaminoacyl peptidase
LSGDLAVLNVEDGTFIRIARGLQLCSYALSPDRRMLAYAVATGYDRPGSYQILVDLFVTDLLTRTTRRLIAAAPLVYAFPNYPVFAWSPDSRAIAYRTDGPSGTKDEVYVVRVDGGAPVRIAGNHVLEEPLLAGRPLWDRAGQRLFFVREGALWQAASDGRTPSRQLASLPGRSLRMVEHGSGALWSPDQGRSSVVITGDHREKRMGFARVDLETGEIVQLLEENKWYDTTRGDPLAVTQDGKALFYVAEDPGQPADLWLVHGIGSSVPRQITHVSPELTSLAAARTKIIEWESLDGDTLRGVLVVPQVLPLGKKLPLVVKVYGGSSVSDDLNRFGFAGHPIENLHLLTSRGYAVLLADSRLQIGSPMLDLLKTVMPGVDRAIASGVVDAGRMAITGHSYGGYSALALVAQTRRFRAAVVRAGFGDLVGAYGHLGPDGNNYQMAWAEQGQGRMGGTLWDVRFRYIENSPVFYFDRVTAPILLIHGDSDRNVPSFLADQVFSSLRRLGKTVEYARYRGEGHWEAEWSLSNQVDYLERLTRWLDYHLRPVAPATVH